MSEGALVKNAADEAQVKEAKKKTRLKEDEEKADLKFILNTIQGRRFLWKYLGRSGVLRGGFIADSNYLYFSEGQRNIGLALLSEINEVEPAAYIQMVKEFQDV